MQSEYWYNYYIVTCAMQILGHKPYQQCCKLTTRDLARQIMRQMHVLDEDCEVYIKHLAILVNK